MAEHKNALPLNLASLRDLMAEWGEPSYRAEQVYRYALTAVPICDMSVLPQKLRTKLSDALRDECAVIDRSISDDRGECVKYLYRLRDDQRVEGVRMRYHHGDTLCLSTQAGCRMGCRFCASTLDGLARNLSPSEMIGQIASANRTDPTPVHNVVLMGSGEPLDNYDNVVIFLKALRDPMGFNIGMRRVSLSTCGIADEIERFAGEGLPLTMCISLHAPDDDIRQTLMPIARSNPLPRLMKACGLYLRTTGRRIIFEYAMIDGVNDTIECAQKLAGLIGGMQCHVNLIPLNPIPERSLRPSPDAVVTRFMRALEAAGISVTRRRTLGGGIEGACGQLRRGARLSG